ncbi:Naringenin-2-oxoglutarate 3-dioxygenase [Nymphaea thermarum]|nr:Naringenin-2-oxoglutarate 3-dioxygenase [Nymphaea thermarum]
MAATVAAAQPSKKPRPFLPTLSNEATLGPAFIRDEDERPKKAYNDFSNDVPVISLAGLESDPASRSAIRDVIVKACEEWGVFQVVDHGVDAVIVSAMTDMANRFFRLPQEEKLRFDMSGGKRGGFIVSSHLQGESVQDWREIATFFTYPVKGRDYSRRPDVTKRYSEQPMRLACKLLAILSEGLGLTREALKEAYLDMDQKVVPDLVLGLKRHTDPGTITLLLQDQVGGLQATKDGGKTWITVQPLQGAFVFNLGDHAHYLSNGRFLNADHQAVVNSNCSRLSIATFQNPAPEAIVHPLKVAEGEKSIMEEPITFAEMYRRKMSRDLDLAKLKKLAKEAKNQAPATFDVCKLKSIEEILAQPGLCSLLVTTYNRVSSITWMLSSAILAALQYGFHLVCAFQ